MALESNFPEKYSSKYSLVTFNENIGYREAMLRGRAQDKAILNLLSDGIIDANQNLENLSLLKDILSNVQEATNAILEDDKIACLK